MQIPLRSSEVMPLCTQSTHSYYQATETAPADGQGTQVEKDQTQSTPLGQHRAVGPLGVQIPAPPLTNPVAPGNCWDMQGLSFPLCEGTPALGL